MSTVRERYSLVGAIDSRVTRKSWAVMLAGLYAELFRRFPTPATLTRWADLEEEVDAL